MHILDKIVLQKQQEIKTILISENEVEKNTKNVYEIIQKQTPFYISEFKRKSPSEGNIGLEINLEKQINKYKKAGTHAISVLTDTHFFGGSFDDLKNTVELVKDSDILVLQKDFIIDESQILLARKNGADLILLIGRILDPTRLIQLKKYAENLGMGVLLELHEAEEFEPLKQEKFPLIGINNRDLDTFKLFLNRFNVVGDNLPKQAKLVAESGIQSPIDISISKKKAEAFLVGTSLMRKLGNQTLNEFYKYDKKYFFKACGLRDFFNFEEIQSDLIGVNFSPVSKRKISEQALENYIPSEKIVGVFKENSFEEIEQIVNKYSLSYVQIYAGELNLEQLKSLNCKKIFAFNPNIKKQYKQAMECAKFVDFFIVDGNVPGSGKEISLEKVRNFPYPFLLAGGININNLEKIQNLKNCIGIDSASGVEKEGEYDLETIMNIQLKLNELEK